MLCFDKIHYRLARGKKGHVTSQNFYLKALNTVETLLHAMSDTQLVSAISLLFTLNGQSCSISAYDFDIVCTMLMLSIVVHLCTMINISDFIFKGKSVAFPRLATIITQLVLTFFVFAARNTSTFPFEPASLAILPAACFENFNATDDFGLSDFANFASNATSNGTDGLWNTIQAATNTTKGLPEYVILVSFVGLALLVILAEWLFVQSNFDKHIGWGSIIICIASTTTGISLGIYGYCRWLHMTNGMHIAAFFQVAKEQKLLLSEILPLSLLGSTILPAIGAITGEISLLQTIHLVKIELLTEILSRFDQ
jgi:hypothetical protein